MAQTPIDIRKRPVQARSKARVEAILNAARAIVSELGSDRMKMNAIAQRAEVPIGTLYQFFPNKSAVIHMLVKTELDALSTGLQAQFAEISSIEDAATCLGDAISTYCRYLREEPLTRDILSATQGDKTLAELDLKDTERNSKMMFDVLAPLIRAEEHEALNVMCFLNAHLTGSLARFCSRVDHKTAAAMQVQFIESVQRDLRAFRPVS